jgi:hypothetical protein
MEKIMEPETEYEVSSDLSKAVMKAWGSFDKDFMVSGKPDLSRISTRELLNECYRRRAIEKFVTSIEAPVEAFQDQEHNSYLIRDVDQRLWHNVVNSGKFYSEAAVHSVSGLSPGYTKTLTSEIYICKHPSKVKK